MSDMQSTQRILIVDDTLKNIQVIGTILREKGYLISVASSGKQAIEVLNKIIPDLVLLDILMPDMNGFETCTLIKQNPLAKDIPVIFLSALTDTADKIQGFSVGAVDYVTKPIQSDELLARISAHLTISKLNKELQQINNQLEEKVIQRTSELEKTQSYLFNIINSMPSILIGVNTDGMITHWNRAAEYKTGFEHCSALGKPFWELFPLLIKFKNIYFDVIKNRKEMIFPREIYNDYETRYSSISIFPLINNNIEGAVIRIDDTTDLETREALLRQAQKMESIGNLAGGIAHDFNNVLGGITGSISLMEYLIKKDNLNLGDKFTSYLDTIKVSSDRATNMVKQLLTLSRQNEMQFAPIDLNNSVKHVLNICNSSFDKSIELKAELNKVSTMFLGDPTQIEQVILNLCINAGHAMTIMRKDGEKKGGVLTITVDSVLADENFVHNHIDSKPNEYYCECCISDTGVGMDEKTRSRIFEPFFTTKQEVGGTGLGLSMVYSIIKQHQGFIDVVSIEHTGTMFKVILPLIKDSNVSISNDHRTNLIEGNGCVLVIDDEKNIREVSANLLEECGYRVLKAENGIIGINLYKERINEIDAVLVDMSMPKMSGIETIQEMLKINPDIKAILISGLKNDNTIKEAFAAGFSDFLQKPYDGSKLSIAVSKLLLKKTANE